MTPTDNSRCEDKQLHKEEWNRSILVMKKAELSLLFLTAAGVVCRLGGDHEWYGFCVLSLALLASGELWGQAKAEDAFPHFKEKREASQEEYHLKAYDCSGPQDTDAYSILQECPDMKELASPSMLSGTKRHNYTIIQEAMYFEYPVTLCTVHRSREYYDCVWKSHV